MVRRETLVKFIDNYLKTTEVRDSSWNGLQVEGKALVRKVVGAVDAGLETFRVALAKKADFLIVHHGLFWKQILPYLTGVNKERIKILLDNQLSLYASHLPLDRHPKIGNNALLLKTIGAKKEREYFLYEGQSISWTGIFQPATTTKEVVARLEKYLRTNCQVLDFGPKKVNRVAVCSGAGGLAAFTQALSQEVDLYVTGEETDFYHLAKDNNCAVIFAGHHATETLGVQALLRLVAARWKLETVFVDIPTGL